MRSAIIVSLFATSVLAQSATTSDFASNPTETATDGVTNSHTDLPTGLFNMTTAVTGVPSITTGTTRPVSNSGSANATGVGGSSGNGTSGSGSGGSGSGSGSSSAASLTFIGGGFLASCVLLGVYANGN